MRSTRESRPSSDESSRTDKFLAAPRESMVGDVAGDSTDGV